MSTQIRPQIRIRYDQFESIGENKRILPFLVLPHGDDPNDEKRYFQPHYLGGIFYLQRVISVYPELKFFIPNSPDIHSLYKTQKPKKRISTLTGMIVLRRDGDGYADKRVTDPDGKRIKLAQTSISEHGISWVAKSKNLITIIEPSKLKPYTEVDAVTKRGTYSVAGYDEERGVTTKFNPPDKPVKRYNNALAWVNPNVLISPLVCGYWLSNHGEKLFGSCLVELHSFFERGGESFSLGSTATDVDINLFFDKEDTRKLADIKKKTENYSQENAKVVRTIKTLMRYFDSLTIEHDSC